LSPRAGEPGANHISCISVWQCTKHEFMNNPLVEEVPCSSSAPRKWSLNPVMAPCVLMNIYTNRCQQRGVKCGSTYPAKSQVASRNIDLYHACSSTNEDQNLLVSKCSLPAACGNGNRIDALTGRCKYQA
jgi:hypothetical protein